MPTAIPNTPLLSINQTTSPSLAKLENDSTQPLRIIAIGDSVVYGYGDYAGGGWVERLRRQWMNPTNKERVLYNLGVRGDRAQDVARRLELEFSRRGELRNKVPDAIILSVGTNDTPRLGKPDGKLFSEFSEFTNQINNLLDLASSLAPVFFVGMTPIDESKMPFLDCLYYNRLDQYRYKEVTLNACRERNIPYLDLFELWLTRGENWLAQQYGADGLHPSVMGYENLLQDVQSWQALSS